MRLGQEFRIGLRYALSGKHDRFVSFVSLMSAAGIALGVAALIIVLAVMGGFHQELRARILSVASHLEATANDEKGFSDWSAVAEQYGAHPEVVATAPQVQAQGLLVNGRQSQGALVRGILPQRERQVSRLAEYIKDGDLAALTSGSYAVALGEQLARRLRLGVGDDFILVSPQGGRLTAAGFYPRIRRLQVAAIFSSGLYQYDSGLAYLHLDDAKRLYRLQGPTSIRLQLGDLMRAPLLKDELAAESSESAYLFDWTTSHGGLFRALVTERRVMTIILMLIIAVAAFNIVSALVTMVRNKRGDIAILRAFGASGGCIIRIFLFQGLIIGVVGVAVGVACGVPLAKNAGDIMNWMETWLNVALFPASVYHLDKLPSIVSLFDTLWVAGVALLLTLLAALYPAWQGGRIRPADALRYE